MRSILIIAVFVTIVSARPEPPVGYNYPAPISSQQHGGFVSSFQGIGSGVGTGFSGHNLGNGGGISSGTGSLGFTSGLSGISSGTSGISGASSFNGASSGFVNTGATQVHKHVYVHVAPEEPEEFRPQKQIPVAPAQKHYKIIFIKAPSPPKYSAPVVPVQPQNEEKTLVYVLVKKPEEQQDIVIPTAAPTKPSKPEVYFIKYNTRKETVSGGTAVGGSVHTGGNAVSSGFGLSGAGSGISGGAALAGLGGTSSIIESSHSTGGVTSGSLGGGVSGLSLSQSTITTGSSGAIPSAQYGPPGYQHK